MDLTIRVKGDLEVDEHHTIEDTAIALGECINQALGSKAVGLSAMAMHCLWMIVFVKFVWTSVVALGSMGC